MRNILKNSTNTLPARLLPQQQIFNLTQRLILKVIPPAINPDIEGGDTSWYPRIRMPVL